MTIDPRWVSVEVALAIHGEQLQRFGGAAGVRDQGLLESALARPQQIFCYEENVSLARLAAAYAFGIAKNHPLVDGNKRTAFLVAYVFLADNGWKLVAPQAEAVIAMLRLAAGEWDEAALTAWIQANLKARKQR